MTISFVVYTMLNKYSFKTSAATGSKVITSQAEWEADTTRYNIDSTHPAGDVKIDDKAGGQIDLASYYENYPGRFTAGENSEDIGNILDGNEATAWAITLESQGDGTNWIKIDFGEVKNIIKLRGKPNGVWYGVNASNNGSDWIEVAGPHGSPAIGWYEDVININYRYLQIYVNGPEMPEFYPADVSLYEFEVYESATSATHTSTATQLDGTVDFTGWTTFVPTATIPANTSINFKFRTSNDHLAWTDWSASTPYAASINLAGLAGFDQRRYLQVESTLANDDGLSTPTLSDYTANYTYSETCDGFDHLTITPASASVQVGGTTTLTGHAWNTVPAEMPGVSFNYIASCGEVDGSGNYTAPATAQTCTVTVTSECGGSAVSTITVTALPPPAPTCSDGIQNGSETGVDCGGSCPACPVSPTCSDGIKNGDETGIDCGGSCPACTTPNPTPTPPEQCESGYESCTNDSHSDYQACMSQTGGSGQAEAICGANYCEATYDCLRVCIGAPGADMALQTNILNPTGGEGYYLSATIPIKWNFKTDMMFDPQVVEMYLSTDNGQNYSLQKALFNSTSHPSEGTYKQAHPEIATDFYNNFPDNSKVYSYQKVVGGYHYYDFKLPVSDSLVSNNVKIKLVPIIYGCGFSFDPGISNSFSITQKPAQLSLKVVPADISIKKGTNKTFTANAYDQYGNDVTASTIFSWDLKGGATVVNSNNNIITIQAGQKLGYYYLKLTAVNGNLTKFNYTRFDVVGEEPYLNGMKVNSPVSTTLVENLLDNQVKNELVSERSKTQILARPIDQYGNYYPSADVSWQVIDSRAGRAEVDSTNHKKTMFYAGKTQGCYPNIIKATATSGDKSFSQYTSVRIIKSIALKSSEIKIKSFNFNNARTVFKSGELVSFRVSIYDELGNIYDTTNNGFYKALEGLTVTLESADSRIGNVSFSGDYGFIELSNNLGVYDPALSFKATYNGQTITSNFPKYKGLKITNEEDKFTHIVVDKFTDYQDSQKGQDIFYIKPNGIINLNISSRGTYDYYYHGSLKVTMANSSAGNFYSPSLFVASKNEGNYQNALKIERILNGKVLGTKYVSFVVSNDVKLSSSCLVIPCENCPPCDPKDAGCCDPNDPNCIICVNPPCGFQPCTGPFCEYICPSGVCSPIVDGVIDYGTPILALLAVLSLLGAGRGALSRDRKEKALSATTGTITALSIGSSIIRYLSQFASGISTFFVHKPFKVRSLGVVFDNVSKKPINGARIQLFSYPDNKLIQTVYSNNIGEFAIMTVPGQFYLKIEKSGYTQLALSKKSQTLSSQPEPFKQHRSDGYYDNIYLTPEVIVQGSNTRETFQVAIPLTPQVSDVSLWARFWHRFFYILEILRIPILIIGTALAIIDFYWHGQWYSWVQLSIFVCLWALELYFLIFRPKVWGIVLDNHNKPVDLALIRLISKNTGKIVSTEVTGKDGKFILNANPGRYVIKVSRAGKREILSDPFELKHLKNLGGLKLKI